VASLVDHPIFFLNTQCQFGVAEHRIRALQAGLTEHSLAALPNGICKWGSPRDKRGMRAPPARGCGNPQRKSPADTPSVRVRSPPCGHPQRAGLAYAARKSEAKPECCLFLGVLRSEGKARTLAARGGAGAAFAASRPGSRRTTSWRPGSASPPGLGMTAENGGCEGGHRVCDQ
jgi:hypothetical protein